MESRLSTLTTCGFGVLTSLEAHNRVSCICSADTALETLNLKPIPAHVWTDYLKHFAPKQTNTPRDLVPRLPCVHQALSDRLQTRQITPANVAIPPGPGGRYRKGSNTSFVLQKSPDHPLLYDIPHEVLLSTYIEQNMARMNTYSSPGFDPFPTKSHPSTRKLSLLFHRTTGL